jgi:hypothetical protein
MGSNPLPQQHDIASKETGRGLPPLLHFVFAGVQNFEPLL